MSEDFVENDETGLLIRPAADEVFRDNDDEGRDGSVVDEALSGIPFESSSVPVVEASPPPVEPVPESPFQTDFSLGDILDSFGAALLAGVSADASVDDESPDTDSGPELAVEPEESLTFVGVETFALSPITSSTGLKGILLDVIGPYDNVVTQFKYQQNTSSNYSYVNEVTPDYPWIASAVLFIVLLLSVFRAFGRCLSWMR